MMANQVTPAKGLESFSTNSVPPQKRIAYWNDLSCNTFTGVEVDSAGNSEFSARLRRLGIDDICIADVWSTASTVRHTARHVSRLREAPHFLLHVQLRGTSVNVQSGREAILRPGDATICDTARPWSLAFNTDAQFLVCRLPTAAVRHRLTNIEDLVGTHLSSTSVGMGLLTPFLRTLLAQAELSAADDWLNQIGTIVLDMVALTCKSCKSPTPGEGQSRSRCQYWIVLQYIDRHLTEPLLSVHSVAQHFGVVARSIQKMFASHGTTLGSYVLKQRLTFAAMQLSQRDAPSVKAVALSSGFGDLTYFGRVFRRSFGVSPSEFHRTNSSPRLDH
jgi:AraC-like DNA-binding protein